MSPALFVHPLEISVAQEPGAARKANSPASRFQACVQFSHMEAMALTATPYDSPAPTMLALAKWLRFRELAINVLQL